MQKIRIIDNGYSDFYTKKHRTERDRPGGHCPIPIKEGINGWNEYHGASGRKAFKKMFAKQARREHARITAEAVQEFYSWDDIDPLNRIPEYDGADDWDDYRDEYGDQDPIYDTLHDDIMMDWAADHAGDWFDQVDA